MIQVNENSMIDVLWDVLPMNYSREEEQSIRHKLSKKLGIPTRNVKVSPNFIMVDANGKTVALTNDTILNIQDPQFQIKLFKKYIDINKKNGYDIESILNIDADINSRIDYDVYSKYKRYSIKWIKWSNFLSYGNDNFFDFTSLRGLCLVNGKPSNQSGKTTFAVELLRFLLFGKTSKFKTLEQNFNLNLPNETELVVEGQIEIDGVNYVIKRSVTRPLLSKRNSKSKVSQKIEYYKVNIDGVLELLEADIEENCAEESGTKTNKAIKEAIGTEQDFDLIICATNDNLRDLISFKDTDRGRLLSRWIGLLPLEEKEKVAKERYKELTSKLLSNKYNRNELANEVADFYISIQSDQETLSNKKDILKDIDNNILEYRKNYELLLYSKRSVDDDLLSLDIDTHNRLIEDIMNNGIRYKNKKEQNLSVLSSLNEVVYSECEFMSLIERRNDLKHEMISVKDKINILEKECENLVNGEFCPVCHRKYENIDNTPLIDERHKTIDELKIKGKELRVSYDEINSIIIIKEKDKINFDIKSKLLIENQSLDLLMDNLRVKLINAKQLLKNYNLNKESIDYNNKISIDINNLNARITTEEKSRDHIKSEIQYLETNIKNSLIAITQREEYINKIKDEEKLKKNWDLYLELVGKNGISKMVLKDTLPIINAELKRLLTDVCNFDVEISVNDKNDVAFYYTKEGCQPTLISGTSGLEKTIASLALRAVLAKISTMPRLNFIVLDEVFSSSIASENYEKLKVFFDRILSEYDFILHVTFVNEIVDWHDNIITVTNINNVSHIVGNKQ